MVKLYKTEKPKALIYNVSELVVVTSTGFHIINYYPFKTSVYALFEKSLFKSFMVLWGFVGLYGKILGTLF
jgi:hypothetical protein